MNLTCTYRIFLENEKSWNIIQETEFENIIVNKFDTKKECVEFGEYLCKSMKPSKLIIEDKYRNLDNERIYQDGKCCLCGDELALTYDKEICESCLENELKKRKEKRKKEELKKKNTPEYIHEYALNNYKSVIVSTTPNLEGYKIKTYLGVESSEVVAGTSIIKDLFAEASDFFGGRASGYENSLSKAKQQAFDLLKYKCITLGGNAVIGIDIDYIEIGNRSTMGVIVGGTIVKVEKEV